MTEVAAMIEETDEVKQENVFISGIKDFFIEMSLLTKFTFRFFTEVFLPPYEFSELAKQCYMVGYKSLPLVGITGFIRGLVLTITSSAVFGDFGAE